MMATKAPNAHAAPMRPEDVLADGVDSADFGGVAIRKGTVAAFLQNAMHWSDPNISAEDRYSIGLGIAAALPALRVLGIFEVFDINDDSLRKLIAYQLPNCK